MTTNQPVMRHFCSLLAAFSLLLQGCWTSQQVVDYCLTDPTAPLVREWVEVGDRVEVVLDDQTTSEFVVSGITETSIDAKDGGDVSIESIDSLTCKSTEREPTELTGLIAGTTGEALVWGGLGGVLIIAASPFIAAAALQDLSDSPIDDWNDMQLCRISRRPGDFGYREDGMHSAKENMPTLDMPSVQEIEREIEDRDVDCSPENLAIKNCAAVFTHGPTFTECTTLVEPLERSGADGIREWPDDSLCRAIEEQPMIYSDVIGTTGLRAASSVKELLEDEAARRDLICSDAESDSDDSISAKN